jgi:sarcosine oxidase subunit gamma
MVRADAVAEVKFSERCCGYVVVAARRNQEGRLDAALRALVGTGLPKPGRAASADDCTALWIAPMTALVGGPPQRLTVLNAIPRDLAAVIDQSGGFAILRISGPKAPAVLAKGCRLDLHPSAFAPGACARTLIGQTPAILHQIDDVPTYDLIVQRTLARSFAQFVIGAAEASGIEISAAIKPEESRTR